MSILIKLWTEAGFIVGTCVLLFVSGTAIAGTVPRNECSNPPMGTIFCEDFEGANPKSHFNDYDGNLDTENQVVSDSGPAGDSLNKVIRLRAPAGQSGGSGLVQGLPGGCNKTLARWGFKY